MAITVNWRMNALCAESPFHAKAWGDDDDEGEIYNTKDAQWFADNVCLECPVMVMCREWVDNNPQEFGVFGGLTAADRNATEDTQ